MVKRVSELRHGVILVVEVCDEDVDEIPVEVVVPVVDVLTDVVLEDLGVEVVVPVVEVLVWVVPEVAVAVVDVLAGVVLEVAVEDITRVENAEVEEQRTSRTSNLQ